MPGERHGHELSAANTLGNWKNNNTVPKANQVGTSQHYLQFSLRFGLFSMSIRSLSFPESVLWFSSATLIIWALFPLLINILNPEGTIFIKRIEESPYPVQHQPELLPAPPHKEKCRGIPLRKRKIVILNFKNLCACMYSFICCTVTSASSNVKMVPKENTGDSNMEPTDPPQRDGSNSIFYIA